MLKIKSLLVILGAALVSLPLGAVAQPSSNYRFNVGIIVPLSGDLAEYGTAIRNGFELAKQQHPADFSNVQFLYEDSRYDGKTAVAALQKLKALNSIDLYYLWGVSPTEAMLPIAAAQGLPVLAETTVKEATVGKPLVVRAARTGERIAQALAAELANRKVRSVSFVVTQIPFYLDILKHLERILKDSGTEVRERTEVLPADADFKSVVLAQGRHPADAIGVLLLPAQLITFFRQAEQAKLSAVTFSADIMDSESIVNECPSNINGTFYTQVGVSSDFRKDYQQAFGDDVQIGSAAQAYDVSNLVVEFFGKLAKRPSALEVISTISKLSPHQGATGSFRYSETADSGKEIRMPVSLKVVRDKKIQVVTEDTGF